MGMFDWLFNRKKATYTNFIDTGVKEMNNNTHATDSSNSIERSPIQDSKKRSSIAKALTSITQSIKKLFAKKPNIDEFLDEMMNPESKDIYKTTLSVKNPQENKNLALEQAIYDKDGIQIKIQYKGEVQSPNKSDNTPNSQNKERSNSVIEV